MCIRRGATLCLGGKYFSEASDVLSPGGASDGRPPVDRVLISLELRPSVKNCVKTPIIRLNKGR